MPARVSPFSVPLLCAMLAACGGGTGGTGMPATTAPRYTLSITANGQAPVAVVLYHAQFAQPFTDVQTLVVSIAPPPADTRVSWSSSSSSVVLSQQQPDFLSPGPTAPPDGTFASIGPSYGPSTVTAHVGPPVNQSISIPVYSYDSVAFGCTFRNTPAFNFDPFAVAHDSSADLYDTIASDVLHQLDPCVNTPFATARGTPELWHIPYGGVLVPNVTAAQFPAVQASQWRNADTAFAPAAGVLIFKTKTGRIVKALLPLGPFEVSNADGTFPY